MVAFTDTPDWRNWKRKQDEIFIVELDAEPPAIHADTVPISPVKSHNIQIQKPKGKIPSKSPYGSRKGDRELGQFKGGQEGEFHLSDTDGQHGKENEMLLRTLLPGILTFCLLSIVLILIPWVFFTAIHGVGGSELGMSVCESRECVAAAELFKRTMDPKVDPCEDFYQFACGNWNYSRPSLSYLDHTALIRERILEKLRKITNEIQPAEDNDNDDEPRAIKEMKTFYDSCRHHNENSMSLDTLRNLIDNLIRPKDSLAQILGRIRRLTGQSYIVDLTVGPDLKDTRKNRIFIDQPELSLPKQILLTETGEVDYGAQILVILTQVWPLVYVNSPIKDVNDTARQILELETQLAQAMTDEDEKTKLGMFNLVPLQVLNELFVKRQALEDPEIEDSVVTNTRLKLNWTEYVTETLDSIRGNITDDLIVNVKDVEFMRKLAAIVSKTSVTRLKNYLRWQLLFSFGNDFLRSQKILQTSKSVPWSSHESGNAPPPTQTTLSMKPKWASSASDEKREVECIVLLDSLLPFALSYSYVTREEEEASDSQSIKEADEILRDVVLSFQEMVAQSSWMESRPKLKAIKKAGKVRPFIGYPKWLPNPHKLDDYYQGLHFQSSDDFLDNMFTALAWISRKNLQNINKPVDTSWSSTGDSALDVDCFYDDELNSITIPLGFLQPPFVGMGLRALDYGALGFFLGHELIHGFDTEGRYSDEDGRLSSWWTPQTLENFSGKTHCIQQQYDNFYVPQIKAKLNGKQTLKENIADNGGIDLARRAYDLYVSRNGKETQTLPGLERFSTDQLLFLSFAQSWCSYVSPKTLSDMVNSNEHSPPKFRVIGPLQNLEAFSSAWSCPNGSKAYMNPTNKCLLW